MLFLGLKTVINELPPASSPLAANICKSITGRLTNAIAKVGNYILLPEESGATGFQPFGCYEVHVRVYKLHVATAAK